MMVNKKSKKQSKKKCVRCHLCKKKIRGMRYVVLISNKCKCEKVFCSNHLCDHNCSYDHQKNHQHHVLQQNPVVKPKSLNRM